MQQRRTGRSGLVRWVLAVVVVVVLVAAGLVAVRVVSDGDDPAAGDGRSDGSGGSEGSDGSGGSDGSDSPGDDSTDDLTVQALGAAALGVVPEQSPAGVPVAQVDGGITPQPAEGDEDVPDLYADDCQLGVSESALKECLYGVPADQARATVAVVGDSKAAQWLPALEILAEKYRWSLQVYTKSACPASTAPVSNAGEVYAACSEFNRQVRRQLTTEPVDLVFTVSGRGSAVSGRNQSGSLQVDPERLSAGLQQMWRVWASVGSKVLVVSDTPKPVDPEDDNEIFDVPACVDENTEDLLKCTFDRDQGVDLGGFRTQDAAVQQIGARNLTRALRDGRVRGRSRPDISFVNIIPWVCPTDTCPAVIGNVLVYRNGSHLTKTYVETLTPLLEKAFVIIGSEPRPRPFRFRARG